MKYILTILLLLLTGSAWSYTHVQIDTFTTLPYAIQSGDSITIDGGDAGVTVESVSGAVLTASGGVNGWIINLENDTLVFNTGGSNGVDGIYLDGLCYDGIITSEGGGIRHGSTTADDCVMIKPIYCHDIDITSVHIQVEGDACMGIESGDSAGKFWNIRIYKVTIDNNTDNFNRFAKNACSIRLTEAYASDTTQSGFEYHARIDTCTTTGPHNQLYLGARSGEGCFIVEGDTLTVDGRNTAGSFANCYAITLSHGAGAGSYNSEYIGNVVRSGSEYAGGRGMIIEYSTGPYDNRAVVRDNDFECHMGHDGEGPTVQVFRIRWGVKNWDIYALLYLFLLSTFGS